MNIVIVGAGAVGIYIATILSREEHNVILVDKNSKRLEEASWQIDVATRKGSGTDWQLLDTLLEQEPDVFIALTDSDEVNLVSCSIAKNLGYPQTIARIRDPRYLNRTRLDFARLFSIDHFVGPELLSAHEILKFLILPDSIAVETFAQGSVQMRTIAIPQKWRGGGKSLATLNFPEGIMVGLIRRYFGEKEKQSKSLPYQVIFPHGNDTIQPGDEVTFIGESPEISTIHTYFGIESPPLKSVVIAGGSLVAINLAHLLRKKNIPTRIIDSDYDHCCELAEILPGCTVINHNATDINFLRSEKIGRADLFVACTSEDEVNIISGLLAQEVGCENSIVMLTSHHYTEVVSKLKLSHVVSPRICAADRILSLTLSGRVTSVVSLYDNQAEIMEIQVSTHSPVIGIPLSELGPLLPKDFLIGVIQNRGRTMIAHGSRVISPGDTVIAICHPKHQKELEEVF